MSSDSLRGMLCLIVCGCLPALSQNAPRIAAVPPDPLELATGAVQIASTSESRQAALQLLGRARDNFALRNTGQGYDLKVTFTVDSGGQTNYDGAWQMEDIFAPRQGHRWTATSESGYTTTGIAANGEVYQDGTASAVPLRLLEARGVLFDPLQSPTFADRGTIRTAQASFHGAAVTCLLLSRSRNAVNLAPGRDWEEAEECIDPQSGLLQLHSEAPGRYARYDYSSPRQFNGRTLPGSVTVTEAGKVVSRISVDSLQSLAASDPSLFIPTGAMKAKGHAVPMTSATKLTRIQAPGPVTSTVALRPVCVFGMVTPTGHLVEAHALQPSDPNSQAAVEDAKKIDFSPLTPAGSPASQHFVYVIEKFAVSQ